MPQPRSSTTSFSAMMYFSVWRRRLRRSGESRNTSPVASFATNISEASPMTPPPRPSSYDKKIGLVLQGGGALGSYQAGVYEALASSEYLPDWVAGISIGAINAAIIAGNMPAHRLQSLRSFWEGITAHTSLWPSVLDGSLATWQQKASALTTLVLA